MRNIFMLFAAFLILNSCTKKVDCPVDYGDLLTFPDEVNELCLIQQDFTRNDDFNTYMKQVGKNIIIYFFKEKDSLIFTEKKVAVQEGNPQEILYQMIDKHNLNIIEKSDFNATKDRIVLENEEGKSVVCIYQNDKVFIMIYRFDKNHKNE